MLRSVCVVGLVLAAFFASGPVQSTEREAKREAGEAFLGLIAGPVAGSETVLAADMASLFPESDLNILPILGDAGAGNLARLDALKVDLAFVSTEVLAEEAAKDASLHERLELVTRLAPQEVHILARADIGKLADLAGREVNFGPQGSASAITAAALFKALQIEVASSSLDFGAAIERLKAGAISAVVLVGGKPSPAIGAVPPNSGIHLLPVSFGEALAANYLPTRLVGADYPTLIEPGGGMLVAAARALYDLDPIVLGKPSQHYADAIRDQLPSDARIVMFGDSQRADIGIAELLGADGVLVTTRNPRPDLPVPHFVTTRVGDTVREFEPQEPR